MRLFQHLAGSLHFANTADALFVSAPTLSRVISRLEQDVGAALFIRNNRRVELTDAGRKVLVFANKVLQDWQKTKQHISAQQLQLSGELKLYCSVTASQTHLPTILDKLSQRYPQIQIRLETGDHALALKRVQAREIDVALAIRTPDYPSHLDFIHIDTIPLVLIAPKLLYLTHIEEVDWTNTSIIMPEIGPSKRIINHWFAEQGIRPKVYAHVGGNEAIVSMVALGCGVGFVPTIVLESSTLQSKVSSLTVNNIEPYSLGACMLSERMSEPLLKAVSGLFKESL